MKKIQLLPVALIALSIITSSASDILPEALSKLKDGKPEQYYYRVKDIPQPVLDAMMKVMQTSKLKMADAGGVWNKTDVTSNPSLPFRRLIWAVKVVEHYVIHYEMGGDGYSTHFLIAAPDVTKGKWFILWSAAGSSVAKDYTVFISELTGGQLDADPRLTH